MEKEYHDHAYDRDEKGKDDATTAEPKKKGARGGVSHPFPEKLHIMLDKVEEQGLDHIVSWHPHGRSFAVHRPKEFVAEIMPLYFKQTKLTSFQRQLNLYGFSRLTTGNDRGGYYHELFLRGRLFLCERMMRTRIKGTGTKAAVNTDNEPDFYSMPSVKPLSQTPRKPPTKTTWKVTYEQPIKKKQDSSSKMKRPAAKQLRRISDMQVDLAPPPKVQRTMEQTVEPPMVQSSDDRILPFPRPSSFSAILPLVMPVLPKSTGLDQPGMVITPPHTPEIQEDVLPPAPEIPEWMLSDTTSLNEPIVFEGKTFHYLDACSFDCLHEDRQSVEAGGFSMKEADEFLAGI